MSEIYTVGIWSVKEGHEERFVEAWRAMGEATIAEFPAAHGRLLRDLSDPRRFISFGPWESVEAVEEWRGSPAFEDGVARIREHLDGFEPGTFELDTEISGPGPG